jgi:hypothetical protein
MPRVVKACDQCARYRRKCDGNLPCVLCFQKKRSCSYEIIAKRRGPKKKNSVKELSPVVNPLISLKTLLITPPPILEKVNPVANWTTLDFLSTVVFDSSGNSGSILDMYFSFPYQHLPMYSKVWFTLNIKDVPLYVLHSIYMLVLVNSKQALIIGKLMAEPHAKFVREAVNSQLEDCDPFMISTMLNLAMYDFYNKESGSSVLHLSMAIKSAQLLGLDRDIDLRWRSTASGRILGDEIGMDRQFLRSLWFLMYQWDYHNILDCKTPMLIYSPIPDYVINSYIPPNVGDFSNTPLKYQKLLTLAS